VIVTAKSNASTIVSLLLPVDDQKEAQQIAGSAVVRRMADGALEISVEPTSGKKIWTFEKGKDGLVLKK
jgi:hypothetical protein